MKKGEATLDRWTLAHVASGVALGLLKVRPLVAVVLLVGFEVYEATLRGKETIVTGKGLTEYESEKNIVADIVAGLLGYSVTYNA